MILIAIYARTKPLYLRTQIQKYNNVLQTPDAIILYSHTVTALNQTIYLYYFCFKPSTLVYTYMNNHYRPHTMK